jgi:monofunctional biosynthetic peptidoglycan transglycosylase
VAAKSRFRRFAKIFLIIALVAAIVPPAQVMLTKLWNPPTSPMQFQRKVEAWRKGSEWEQHPIEWVKLKDTPPQLIHFIWASEDQAFFQHGGFDLPQLRKAMNEAKAKGKEVTGASTITMQCARSVFLWQGRSYIRKGLEAYYTFWMELLLSKQRILELYLNHIEMGPGIYGIGAAAEQHFGKPVGQLSRSQMMALAAILPNPLNWSPVKPDAKVQKKIRRVERLSSRAPFPTKELPER